MRPGEKCENVDAERIKILVGCVTSDISPSSICRRVLSDFLNFASQLPSLAARYFARRPLQFCARRLPFHTDSASALFFLSVILFSPLAITHGDGV
jgi:hypothetical protein